MNPVLEWAVATDPGLRRPINEDSVYVSPRLQAVADGMGGHGHGDLASAIAVTVLREFDAPGADLAVAVAEISRRLNLGAPAGTGTTLTAMLWDGPRFQLAHIGDSRGYLVRGGALYQLTTDHTMVQALVDDGKLTPEQAAGHPRRSMLMRALQSGNPQAPDLSWHEAAPGDRYLLCSDGLTDYVSPEAVHEVLTTPAGRDETAQHLVALANHAGGPDNITCVLTDVIP